MRRRALSKITSRKPDVLADHDADQAPADFPYQPGLMLSWTK
jgi:hypothetical protein